MGKAKKTKQKDFVKKKLKVGKSKQPANNATNLSFQSKQIRINEQVIFDNQTVFEDKNLSKHFLIEKLGQLSNNSDSVRSDAVNSIKTVFDNAPNIILSCLGQVSSAIAKSIIDLDDVVGKGINALAIRLFDLIDHDPIIPFFHYFVIYSASGISHINERVRIRSVRFTKMLMDFFPELMARNSARLIPHFLQIITGRGFSSSLKDRHEVLECFEKLLLTSSSKVVYSQDKHFNFAWDNSGVFHRYPFLQDDSVINESLLATPSNTLDLSKKTHKKLFGFQKGVSSICMDELFSQLIAFWIESFECILQCSELKQSPQLKTCSSILNLLSLIWPESSSETNLPNECHQILLHISSKFPFGKDLSFRDEELSKILTYMNMNYCSIGFRLASETKNDSQKKKIVDDIFEYVLKLLKAPFKKNISMIPFTNIFSLLETDDLRYNLLEKLLIYQEGVNDIFNAAKCFSTAKTLVPISKMVEFNFSQKWILGLPKQLWKLKNKNESFSLEICHYLKEVMIQVEQDSDIIQKIQLSLIPLFTKTDKSTALFVKLTSKIQLFLLEILYYSPFWNDILSENIVHCCFECSPEVNLKVFDASKDYGLKCSVMLGYSLKQLVQLDHKFNFENQKRVFNMPEDDIRLKNYKAMRHLSKLLPDSCYVLMYNTWLQSNFFGLSPLSFCTFLNMISYREANSRESLPNQISESIVDAIQFVYVENSDRLSYCSDSIAESVKSFFQRNPTWKTNFLTYCTSADKIELDNFKLAISFIQEW